MSEKCKNCSFFAGPNQNGLCSGCFMASPDFARIQAETANRSLLKTKLTTELKQVITERKGLDAIKSILEPIDTNAEYLEGPVGEAFDEAVNYGDISICKYLLEKYPNAGILKRLPLQTLLTNIRENLFKGSATEKNDIFEYLANLPGTVDGGACWVASTIHKGSKYVKRLKTISNQQAKKSKLAETNEEEEEEEESAQPPTLTSEDFIQMLFVDLLDCKKLKIWSDGEVTSEAETKESILDELKQLQEFCEKIQKEFEKDEWEEHRGSENWRGFFIKSAGDESAGTALARSVLEIKDKANQLEVVIKPIADSRKTLWPQRYYFHDGHVSNTQLTKVKRASNLVKNPIKKTSLEEVKFHCPERAWYWPPVALVGRWKKNPDYLVGLLYVTHDQDHLHHGQ